MSRSGLSKFAAAFFAAEIRAWRGEEKLWKVFWGYGIAISSILASVYAVAIYVDRIALQQVLLLTFMAYTAWILISVWRCASNTMEKLWGLLARFLTVAWAANTILVMIFLQLDLLRQYFQN
jgi:hypothetical protein